MSIFFAVFFAQLAWHLLLKSGPWISAFRTRLFWIKRRLYLGPKDGSGQCVLLLDLSTRASRAKDAADQETWLSQMGFN